jgi:hypothetical protein
MLEIVAAAVKNTAWQETNGIIKEGSDNANNNDGIGFKGAFPSFFLLLAYSHLGGLNLEAIYIRGLFEVFRRTPGNEKVRILLHSYIDVQVKYYLYTRVIEALITRLFGPIFSTTPCSTSLRVRAGISTLRTGKDPSQLYLLLGVNLLHWTCWSRRLRRTDPCILG